jgi:hypothetical protein
MRPSIQKKAKIRSYMGKRQFTVIVHSNRAKMRIYQARKHFIAIIHSKKAQKTV